MGHLEPSWRHLAAPWGHPRATSGCPELSLGSSYHCLWPSWGHLEASCVVLEPFWSLWFPLWSLLQPSNTILRGPAASRSHLQTILASKLGKIKPRTCQCQLTNFSSSTKALGRRCRASVLQYVLFGESSLLRGNWPDLCALHFRSF